MSPPNDIKGSTYFSHGIEVYHKPRSQQAVDHDAGFNLQKLAWIEDNSPDAFAKVRVVSEVSDDTVLVEHKDSAKVGRCDVVGTFISSFLTDL